ncbi:lipoprotein, putative [Citrifermentans bemidjiense Bem]|uniref:Lipoprotein, putative n=1 Tax=Citrifermentans bemidjiense (strain ATCC BAA-1014 / DSM 16622 / JCM 12645 / Bem) TaxID=404380 RepID=B5EIM6_CITBB|nr:M15 family metallopeptidase [Citrifermentans bemidjiense]ACH38391.1 lipoprotein, putative [Citrifermentans bemidjiense Bem]
MRPLRTLLGSFALLALSLSAGCGSPGELPRRIQQDLDTALLGESRQLLYVDAVSPASTGAALYPLQRGLLGWQLAAPPVPVNLGRNGVAPPFEKREGDGRTPSGLFPLRRAFGYQGEFKGRFPYQRVDSQDLWVDDVHSPDYNLWVRRGQTMASSYEELLRPDPLYKYALAPEYNEAPVVRGLGSAIFIHVESKRKPETSGCISMPEKELVQVMQWLDPEKEPQLLVAIAPALELASQWIESQLPADLPPEMALRLTQASRLLALKRKSGFFAAAVTLPPQVSQRMLEKGSWRPECPVPLEELSYLVTSYWGFDGRPHYGELVVHASLCAFVMDSLHHAFNGRFPIERMELAEAFGADEFLSMAANNTSAFNCREVPGRPGVFSTHSYGAAIDINPRQNPYLQVNPEAYPVPSGDAASGSSGDTALAAADFCRNNGSLCSILPAASASFLDRGDLRPGMLQADDPLLSAFRQRGFSWGGAWRFPDYQHLEYDIRKLNLVSGRP